MLANTFLVTLGVGVLYLLLVRFLDLNEKEPLWAIAMLFVLGAGAAVAIHQVVPSTVLALTVLPSSAAKESARFGAILAGVGVLAMLGARRGWSEIDGVMDGLVYGASGGFGFATGEVLARSLAVTAEVPGLELSLFPALGRAALEGLADGVFGALIGAGVVAAIHTRQAAARAVFPLAGYAAAVLAHAGHVELSQGNALGGTQAVVRAWAGLLLPLLAVVAVGVVALTNEKRAIREQLAGEADGGVVTADDFALLTNLFRRQGRYLEALVKARVGELFRLRALHNRQVQLALAKKRAAEDARAREQVDKLRAAVLELKRGAR